MSSFGRLEHLERMRACRGKQMHKSLGAAEAALRSLQKREFDSNMEAYYCRFC